MTTPIITPLGDRAIRVELGNTISPEINRKVHQFVEILEKESVVGVVEIVPAYCTVTVYYQPLLVSYDALKSILNEKIDDLLQESPLFNKRRVTIPVFYGGKIGIDLNSVAAYTNLTPTEVIKRHTARDYLAYMIGFTPGFPYLGGMDPALATPRKKIPRKNVFAGSVGIAGAQTGIYSIDSPGGWQIIGHTPISLFSPSERIPVLMEAGDIVRFQEIDEETYYAISEMVKKKEYEPVIEFL